MISKKEVKYIQSLSDKKNRNLYNVFVAEGPKLVAELLDNGFVPEIIYATKESFLHQQLSTEIREVSASELQRISHFETANEVIGIFPKKKLPAFHPELTITLLLDGIQDPGNMGTIIRTADWFGIRQIIASPDSVDCYNAKAVQSTMGSIARVHVYYEDPEMILSSVNITTIGARLNGKSLSETDRLTEGILIIGNESKGIRSNILPYIQQSISIPRTGEAESLNAAVAAGILLSHLIK